MRKPIIGITVESKFDPEDSRTRGNMELNWNYAQAVADAGGVPLIIPPVADMSVVAELIDGWLIPGGADIDANNFGEENHPAVELQDPSRFHGEQSLYAKVAPEMPILGICYGCQFLNVIRGGTLIQHLPDVETASVHTGGILQVYKLEKTSRLGQVVGSPNVEGKSYHHQAVRDSGAGLAVVARSDDGTVEAVEATDRPWLIGVQWHPERTAEDPASRRLFNEFILQASRYAESKSLVAR